MLLLYNHKGDEANTCIHDIDIILYTNFGFCYNYMRTLVNMADKVSNDLYWENRKLPFMLCYFRYFYKSFTNTFLEKSFFQSCIFCSPIY